MARTIKNTSPRRLATRPFLVAAIVVALLVAAALVLGTTRTTPQEVAQASAPHFADLSENDHHAVTGERTTVIARLGEQLPHISGEEGPLMTTLVRGQLPDTAITATVRTDENCAADAEGISHCLNELDFGSTTVVVQHHHAMAKTSCLTPGEVVRVMSVDEYHAQS